MLYETFIHINTGAVKMAKAQSKVAEEVVEQTETANPETTAGEDVVESISLVDLNSLAQIIDLASSRGAFRGGELEPIGALFNKLTAFLGSVKNAQDAAAQKENADGASAEAPGAASAGE